MSAASHKRIQYFTELRRRILKCLAALFAIFMILLYFANDLYHLLALPLLKQMPNGHGLIAINVVSPFFVPFELSFIASLLCAMPLFLYEMWAFVAPGLYLHEKRLIWPLILLSVILFYLGVAFAYFVVFPLLFTFFMQTTPQGVALMPDMATYFEFSLKLLVVFGAIFEVPILTMVIILTGIRTREQLIQMRPYVIIAAFVIGMFLSPPDVFSQTLLAIPLWLLFEVGLLLAPLICFLRQKAEE